MDPQEIFIEDAISDEEAIRASERYVAYETEQGLLAIRLAGEDDPGPLISLDEAMDLLERRLEAGFPILMGK